MRELPDVGQPFVLAKLPNEIDLRGLLGQMDQRRLIEQIQRRGGNHRLRGAPIYLDPHHAKALLVDLGYPKKRANALNEARFRGHEIRVGRHPAFLRRTNEPTSRGGAAR